MILTAERLQTSAAMSSERRDPEGASRRDLAVGERQRNPRTTATPKPASGQDANYKQYGFQLPDYLRY